ncbi:MAG: hypothetical protein HW416_3069 [Chloroflexi bacterium]|nr:hypothetical protein [Chloroflexota bacterium]
MTQRARVFFDASVLLAAAGSPEGGSTAAIALLANSDQYEPVVSAEVLQEALGNLRLKFKEAAVIRFYQLLGQLRPVLAGPGPTLSVVDLPPSLAAKDHHVVRSCLTSGASICLTLDRRHFLGDDIRRWGIEHNLRLLTPVEFLAWERIRHLEDVNRDFTRPA